MLNRLTAPFLLFSVALGVWVLGAGLSSYLAAPKEHQHQEQLPERSTHLKELEAKTKSSPADVATWLNYALGAQEEAVSAKNMNLLMDSVNAYQRVLELSPENADALLGLASLCFEAGILDKAIGYYQRYLVKRPEDLRAKTDLSLALIQTNELTKGEEILNQIVKSDPNLFQAHLALALVWKLQGKVSEAKAKAEEAKKLAPTDEDRNKIDSFIADIKPLSSASKVVDQKIEGDLSPAKMVGSFFEKHPIIGPNLRSVTWASPTKALISVAEFPVAQMPEFARVKFEQNVKGSLASLPGIYEIILVDAASSKELMSIKAGRAD